jgi:hypothetical protein
VLVASAVCPHPPALLPALASGAASELDDLRTACDRALDELVAAEPVVVVIVGIDDMTRSYDESAWGTFAAYGAPVEVSLGGPRTGPASLPLSLAVGAWLLDRIGWKGRRLGQGVADTLSANECAAMGVKLAEIADRVAFLVMGDGSARRSTTAPGYLDPRAEAFDANVVAALELADVEALRQLDPVLARELLVAGRAPWQVLAGAWGDDIPDAQLLYAGAPYGVAYTVAVWTHHG